MRPHSVVLRWARPVALIFLLAVFVAGAAGADEHSHGSDSDWLVFLTGQAHRRSSEDLAPEDDYDPVSADILYSHSSGHFRVLTETFAAADELDVERAQIGYEIGENTLLWGGRFHQPSSAWNIEHHHGQYLQTAITRPGIELWEDEGGLIPQHIVGAFVETRGALGDNAGLTLSAGAGLAPVIVGGQMVPIGLFHPNVGGYQASWSARVGLLPELLGDDSIGLVAARHSVGVRDAVDVSLLGATNVGLDVLGAFARLNPGKWHVQATVYDIEVRLSGLQLRHEQFGAGYLQVERQLPRALTAFGRIESSTKAGDSVYATLQRREFELRRGLGGLRWDFAKRQALTLELAHAATLAGRFNEARLQWSGLLP